MSHTPGPWRWDKAKAVYGMVGSRLLAGADGAPVVELFDSESTCAECDEGLQMWIKEGDAALIVAAPELLEALKEIKARLEVYDPTCPFCGGNASSGHRYTCLWHVANAAIRKARGEE